MRTLRAHALPVAVILALTLTGIAAAGYVLVKQRLPVPLQDRYEVRATVPAADGVAPGLGQAVNVLGVRVGTISKARLEGGNAELTLEIDARKLRAVHRDGRVDLRPITPLKDMELSLDPGSPRSGRLPDGGRLAPSTGTSPVPLADLLSTLDADTRSFLSGLVDGLGVGTRGRAADIRKTLVALGPTAGQVRDIARELDARRGEMARLVTNVSTVTRAATSNGRLADAVSAGNETMRNLAEQDRPLRAALAELPATLAVARSAVPKLGALSTELRPALADLAPPVRDLERTLRNALTPATQQINRLLPRQLRPLSREVQPLLGEATPAIQRLAGVLPDLSRVLQVLRYGLNEIGYNPPGKDEGLLFWLAWTLHNWGSLSNTADAHGSIIRASLFLECHGVTQPINLGPLYQALLGTANACPANRP